MHHVVFAITSMGYDIYSAMTRVAIASIRLTNPKFTITVACDSVSNIALTKFNHPLIKEADHWQVVDTPNGVDSFRNRFVKTSLRRVISGPFLFLDSDILVRGDLSPIFETDADIAGARNHSKEIHKDQICVKDQDTLDAMNWQVSELVYINGGVIFYNDTPKAFQFAETWHNKWFQVWGLHNRYWDQPSLNSSLFDCQPRIHILEDTYNAQIVMSIKVAFDAKLLHYYCACTKRPVTQYEYLLNNKKFQNNPDLKKVRKMVKLKHPYRREFIIDDLIARKIEIKGNISIIDQTWLEGNRLKALKIYFVEKYINALKNLIGNFLRKFKGNDLK